MLCLCLSRRGVEITFLFFIEAWILQGCNNRFPPAIGYSKDKPSESSQSNRSDLMLLWKVKVARVNRMVLHSVHSLNQMIRVLPSSIQALHCQPFDREPLRRQNLLASAVIPPSHLPAFTSLGAEFVSSLDNSHVELLQRRAFSPVRISHGSDKSNRWSTRLCPENQGPALADRRLAGSCCNGK